ncbi:MAG: 4'-phosphopantetheinyl transferase family protein [Vulcanimicrobiota bacterium]
MIEIFAKRIEIEEDTQLMETKFEILSQQNRDKVERLRFREDKIRTGLGELLVRDVLKRKFDLDDEEIDYQKDEYGKPFVGKMEDFYFNISHSGHWVVCALGGKPLGIDVEKIEKVDLNIANKFFTKHEQDALFRLPEEEQLDYFFQIWTLKESFIKAQGKGLAIPLGSFTVVPDYRTKKIFFQSEDFNEKFYFRQFYLEDNYKLAVCARERHFSNELVIFEKLFHKGNNWLR